MHKKVHCCYYNNNKGCYKWTIICDKVETHGSCGTDLVYERIQGP